MSQRNVLLLAAFVLISVIELTGRFLDSIILEYVSKPFIMILIAVYFLLNSRKKQLRLVILMAFFFSWLGDMLLMFSGGYNNEMLFYAGVGAFFFAQLSYIIVFLRNRENKIKGLLLRNPFWALPLIAFGVGICYLLYPVLEGIMVPVIFVYATALVGMTLAALNRRDRVGVLSFRFVFYGSIFFLLSDSMIAINKFYTDIPYAGFLIMLTYIIAQFMIMQGLVLEKEKPTDYS